MIGDLPIGMPGLLGVVCGPMKSGKTEQIIRLANRLEHQKNISFALYKPSSDTRSEDLYSRDGRRIPCTTFSRSDELLDAKENLIIVDEAQFCDEKIVEVVTALCKKEKHVLILGLDLDRNGRVFGPMGLLLAHADYVKKINAYCDFCGQPSRYSQYQGVDNSQGQVLIGDKQYFAVCRTCYKKQTE